MTSYLKKLWVASARVEDLEVELDQSAEERDTAVVEAIGAGFPLDQVAAAANLSRAEVATIALAASEKESRDGEAEEVGAIAEAEVALTGPDPGTLQP